MNKEKQANGGLKGIMYQRMNGSVTSLEHLFQKGKKKILSIKKQEDIKIFQLQIHIS